MTDRLSSSPIKSGNITIYFREGQKCLSLLLFMALFHLSTGNSPYNGLPFAEGFSLLYVLWNVSFSFAFHLLWGRGFFKSFRNSKKFTEFTQQFLWARQVIHLHVRIFLLYPFGNYGTIKCLLYSKIPWI